MIVRIVVSVIIPLFIMASLAGAEPKDNKKVPPAVVNQPSPESLPSARALDEARSLAYLQRAFFALEQAMHFAQKSASEKKLPAFDYAKLEGDINAVKGELELYLYPRQEKVRADAKPFTIEADYFLDEIVKNK